MTLSNKGRETKQKLILHTYHKLQQQPTSDLTVRKLAGECGYSPAALYRYFGSLEDLIAVASVRFLYDYISDYAALLDSGQNFMAIYQKGWNLFNHYAFERPDIYYGLYWGDYNGKFASAIEEYFTLFPLPHSQKDPTIFRRIFFSSNIYERDLLVLEQGVKHGLITMKDALFFCKTTPLIAKGLLDEYVDQDAEKRKEGERECNRLIAENLQRTGVDCS